MLAWQYNNGHLKARSVHKSLRFSNKLVFLRGLDFTDHNQLSGNCWFIAVCKSALDKSRVSGELFGQTAPPFIKLGRSIRYRVEDLKAWLNRQQTYENLAEAEAEKKFGQNPNLTIYAKGFHKESLVSTAF